MAKIITLTIPGLDGIPVKLTHDKQGSPLLNTLLYGVLCYPDGSYVVEAIGCKKEVEYDA